MLDPLMAEFLKDFAQELYHRAAAAKSRDERMAIKGVQHSLERALERYAIASFERTVQTAVEQMPAGPEPNPFAGLPDRLQPRGGS